MRSGDAATDDAAKPALEQKRAPAPKWVRSAAKALPATWVTTGALVLFLGVTALFGGLAAAPPVKHHIAQLAPGKALDTGQLEVTVRRAVLIDELPGSGTVPDDGERVLVVTATMKNLTDAPVQSGVFADEQITVDGLPAQRVNGRDEVASVARVDDATLSPDIQPGLAVDVAFTWPVPADLLHADDTIDVHLSKLTWFEPKFLSDEAPFWTTPTIKAADMRLAIDDVGAGADQEAAG